MLLHGSVQGSFTGMSKWRMTEVMHQGQRLNQVFIQPQLRRNRAGNLGDFNGVRQPIAEVVGVAAREYLRLIFQATKGPRVNHPVAVTLEVVAIRMPRLWIAASAGIL